jgi:hypothetical protein
VHGCCGKYRTDGNGKKYIYDYEHSKETPLAITASNISPYLIDGPDLALPTRTYPICSVPKMSWGNKPTDGGHFILSPSERLELINAEPEAEKYVRPYLGGGDFINGIERYCLWLPEASPKELRALPKVLARIESVAQFRSESKAASTRAYSKHPTRFRQIAQPKGDYLAIPEVSSERRTFIPIAFVPSKVICSNTIQFVPDANRFIFGVLTSSMHMAWVRHVCGRLKSDYRYSNSLVYNNFPWPESPSEKQVAAVEEKAQAVLDARAKYPDSSLADLYDPLAMPKPLADAHAALDRAVDACYRKAPFHSDRERVEFLFALYEKLTQPLTAGVKEPKRRKGKAGGGE